MWKSLLASLFLATAALAQENPSAYEALAGGRDATESRHDEPHHFGHRGRWRSATEDLEGFGRRTGARTVVCARSRWKTTGSLRSGFRTAPSLVRPEGITINTARLNLDSTGAYAVASHTAETSHVIFSFVSYTLRTDDRGNPVWIVTLEDRSRKPVGTIHIKANDGRVTRVEGMYQGRNMEQVEDDREQADNHDADSEDDSEDNVVKRNIKRLFRKTKEERRGSLIEFDALVCRFRNRWPHDAMQTMDHMTNGATIRLARSSIPGMEGDMRHAAHVDADRGKGSSGPVAMDQSFLARHALSHGARADHFADSFRRARFSNRF